MNKVSIFNTIRSIANTVEAPKFLESMRKKAAAFIRNRKMPFCDIIYFIMNACNRSVQAELDDYFDKKGVEGVSRQAFSKARENLNHEAFIRLNDMLINKFEDEDGDIATYRG